MDIDIEDTSAIIDGDGPGRPPRAPPNPASVKINVEGAFIVDEDASGRNGAGSEFVHWERNDIRLPHHTDVVSHVAVDVRTQTTWPYFHLMTLLDWRLFGKAGILLPRTWFDPWRRPVELR